MLFVRKLVFWLLSVMRFGLVRIFIRLLFFCVFNLIWKGWLFVLLVKSVVDDLVSREVKRLLF